MENLGAPAFLVGEEEEVSAQRIAPKALANQRAQALETLAEVDRSTEGVDANVAANADHESARASIKTCSKASPSMRWPPGKVTTNDGAATGAARSCCRTAGFTTTRRSGADPARIQLANVCSVSPSLWAIRRGERDLGS